MSTPQDPLVGRVLVDRFQLLERIGEGGTGIVYKAKQTSVGRMIAIKVLSGEVASDPSWVRRFSSEARTAGQLDNPHTIRIIDSGQTPEGLLYIAMELLSGSSLHTELAKVGRMPVERVLRILIQICESLQEAHQLGIIHRDIKPENIFLLEGKGGGDFVKVIDFSIAKVDDDASQAATRAGMIIGTPAYMSPEQAIGQKLTIKSDLYACGIVAYEMLAGRPPFQGRLPMEIVMMQMRERPAPLQGVPEPVAALVMKALEKNPNARHESAAAMGTECEQCLQMLGAPLQVGGTSSSLPMIQAPPVVSSGSQMVAGPGGRTVAIDAGGFPPGPPQGAAQPGGGRTVALDAGGFPAPAQQQFPPQGFPQGGAFSQSQPVAQGLAQPPRSRSGMLIAVGLVVVLAFGGGTWFLLHRKPAQQPAQARVEEPARSRRTPPPPPELEEEEEEKPAEKAAVKQEEKPTAKQEPTEAEEPRKGGKGKKGRGGKSKGTAEKEKKPGEKKATSGKHKGKKKPEKGPGIDALF